MKKVLSVIPDTNKEKFITRGFSQAFKAFSYFVYEVKICDLNIDEILRIKPDIIFIFWSEKNKNILERFVNEIKQNSIFIHCSEYLSDIPAKFKKLRSHYIFTNDDKRKKTTVFGINEEDYKMGIKLYFDYLNNLPREGYKYNITFCGNPSYENREIILSELIKNFGVINIFCSSFDFYKSVENISEKNLLNNEQLELYRNSYRGYVNTTKELCYIYHASNINIDIANPKPKDINYRVLEITASNAFVIAPYTENLVKIYKDGKDIETYKNIYELVDKIKFYMKNDFISENIAINGKENTIDNFSYYDRLETILKVIYGKNFSSR